MKRLILSRDHMTKAEKLQEYSKGFILKERMMGTIAFQLNGNHYTSSKRRARKGKPYSLKSDWKYYGNSSILRKYWLILTGKVHKIQKN